jgi:hypothetical protein
MTAKNSTTRRTRTLAIGAGALLVAGLLGGGIALATGADDASPTGQAGTVQAGPHAGGGNRGGAAGGRHGEPAQLLAGLPAADSLTAAEAAELTYMREEELLAHDLYTAFADRYDIPIFATIAASETQHFELVGALLDRYNLPDPAAGHTAGVFTDPTLQATYDQLLAGGTTSQADALRAGVSVEEQDIADLRQALDVSTAGDVEEILTRLEAASQHHLAAFTGQLAAGGAAE